MRVKKLTWVVAGIAALALTVSACGSSSGNGGGGGGTGTLADCSKNPNTCNSGKVKKGGTFTYTIEKKITGWNLNSATTSTFDIAEALDGVFPSVFTVTPDLKTSLNTDLMVSAEQTKTSPQTLVYKIQPAAVWSDGTPINVDDFEYAWKSEDPAYCKDCGAATNSGYDQIQSMTGADSGKTVTVVMKKPYTDWQGMFGSGTPLYPAHLAKLHGGVDTPAGLAKSFAWFDKNQPTISGGPYTISQYDKDVSVTEVPNPKWYGKVKPSLDKLIFRIITDQTQEVPALQNNEVQAIYPQPTSDLVASVRNIDGVTSSLGKGLIWEHLDFNETNPLFKDKVLRTAIFTAVNRKQVIDKTIGQFVPDAAPLNNHMYMPNQQGYADNITATGQGSGDVTKAKSMLTSAGYTGVGSSLKNKEGKAVKFRCSFTAGNVLRQQSCVLVQAQLRALGITVLPTPIDDLGGTLDSGDFDMIIYAWVGAPFVFSGAQQIWVSTNGSDFGHNVNPLVDRLLNEAASSTDPAKARGLVNQADIALTGDAYVLPLFQKPTFLATYSNVVNIRDNATNIGPPYNVEAWGMKQ
jgi:peptide/nickel transport system substrate-binding protein